MCSAFSPRTFMTNLSANTYGSTVAWAELKWMI